VARDAGGVGWNHYSIGYCGACKTEETKFHRRRIFSLSLGDWLDAEVPIEWLAEMLDTIRQCDRVTWILCTKRPENFKARVVAVYDSPLEGTEAVKLREWIRKWLNDNPPTNIIVLTSVENQAQAEIRIPELLKIPAACRGLSLEPLLGPVELRLPFDGPQAFPLGRGLQWLIIGGESGPNARPCNVEWIRSLVQQGKAAGVATFVKQLGENPVADFVTCPGSDGRLRLRDKKGGDPAEWTADLRVQEWPTINR
jgi:protein gp37